jgi:2-polyprenyl-6-hydroxyphenyl methylase/3-demethylubiquinone-9 3-methyltransferase
MRGIRATRQTVESEAGAGAKRRVYIRDVVRGPQPRQGSIDRKPGSQDMNQESLLDSTVDPREVARFSELAAEWWDPRGKMRALHKFNPVRLGFIRDAAARRFGRDPRRLDSLAGLRVLDIGCGGGILSEPLARLGASVVGADPSAANIEAARVHAAKSGVGVDYRATTAEALADAGETFDLVLAMEVVEHVADLNLFVRRCAAMVRPGGLMIAATINRTLKSFALAIVGAEYILRWLPRGTHQWDKLVTPNELEGAMERGGLRQIDEAGVIYNVLADAWQLGRDMDVNYMLVAERPAS